MVAPKLVRIHILPTWQPVSPVCVVRLSDGESAEGDVHDGVPRGDEAVEQAERRSHQQGGPVAARRKIIRVQCMG